ncbi:hypothetical protein PanWU01x14_097610 [Parasponia andersonii]|uniref:Uncharacterized protein n=1 Tax=Parasponia andersonii TaxID=3476 RepID=A0A2P5D4H8_PARAD|nr:hypothetical protein PanWU01x14_097610 [Parasponia andersonii]
MGSNPKNTLPNSFKLSHNFPKVRSNAGGGGTLSRPVSSLKLSKWPITPYNLFMCCLSMVQEILIRIA